QNRAAARVPLRHRTHRLPALGARRSPRRPGATLLVRGRTCRPRPAAGFVSLVAHWTGLSVFRVPLAPPVNLLSIERVSTAARIHRSAASLSFLVCHCWL